MVPDFAIRCEWNQCGHCSKLCPEARGEREAGQKEAAVKHIESHQVNWGNNKQQLTSIFKPNNKRTHGKTKVNASPRQGGRAHTLGQKGTKRRPRGQTSVNVGTAVGRRQARRRKPNTAVDSVADVNGANAAASGGEQGGRVGGSPASGDPRPCVTAYAVGAARILKHWISPMPDRRPHSLQSRVRHTLTYLSSRQNRSRRNTI